MMSKISVHGEDMHPLYKWLTTKDENGVQDAEVKWNFQKFLIDENGHSPYYFFALGIWYPNVGLLWWGYPQNAAGTTYGTVATFVIAIDGIFAVINQILQLGNGLMGWWPKHQWALTGGSLSGPAVEYRYEPKVLGAQEAGPDLVYGDGLRLAPYIRLEDRRLFMSGFDIYANVDGVETLEYTLPFQGKLRPGRSQTDVFAESGSTQEEAVCCFYNTELKVRDSILFHIAAIEGSNTLGVRYVPEYQVIVSIHQLTPTTPPHQIQIRVWSLEVAPTVLSDITVVGGTIHAGQIATFQVTLTGAQNEPCIGELIDWAVTGIGTVLDVQSVTDATGMAETRVLFGVTESGECVVTASVKC